MGIREIMHKWTLPAAGAVLLLGAALLLPRLPMAESTAEAANVTRAEPKGYRTCFVEQQLVSSGTPRLETKRRCVFEE